MLSRIRLVQMIRKEGRQLLRDPKAKPMLLASPVLQFVLLAYAATTDVERIRTVIVDHDRTADSRALIDAHTSTGYFEIVQRADRPEAIAAALDRSGAMVGIMIPSGFSRDLRSGRGARIQALVDGSDASVATVAQSYVEQVAGRFGTTASTSVRGGVELRSRAWYNPSLLSRYFNVPAILGMLLLSTCMMLTTMCVVREREMGTLDQLQVSPLKPAELIMAKLMPVVGVAVFHLLIFTVLTVTWFAVPFRGTAPAMILAALLFILAVLAIGLLISAVSKTQQEAFMLLILALLPTVILSGFLSPVESMPRWLQWATVLNPVRHFLDIMRGVFLKGTGVAELWPQYLALLALGTGTLALATNRYRRSLA
jgi:ABC-2 type transport system permease protein